MSSNFHELENLHGIFVLKIETKPEIHTRTHHICLVSIDRHYLLLLLPEFLFSVFFSDPVLFFLFAMCAHTIQAYFGRTFSLICV